LAFVEGFGVEGGGTVADLGDGEFDGPLRVRRVLGLKPLAKPGRWSAVA